MTLDRDTLMSALNLETKRSPESRVLWAVGIALGGAVLGAGIALLLAPKAGTELRKDLLREAKSLIGPLDGHLAEAAKGVENGSDGANA